MRYADFPLGMRVVLIWGAMFFLLNVILFGIGITTVVALLSDKGINALAGAIIGAIVGSSGTLLVQRYMAGLNRRREAHDVTATLHAEISDRAARCLNDYLVPWKSYADPTVQLKDARSRTDINKFRPMSPVAYPAVASKLGLLSPEALFCVTQFYFRLGVVQREIDDLLNDKRMFEDVDLGRVKKSYAVVTGRLKDTLGPALEALRSLRVADPFKIEDAAVRAYPHTRTSKVGLREGLEAHQREKT